MSEVILSVEPKVAAFDQVVNIQVRNLSPKQHVTFRSILVSELKDVFHCIVHYDADERGVVNVETHSAIGGMYSGVEPMGLFWAMEESNTLNRHRNIALFKKDITKPYNVTIAVFDGHIYDEDTLNKATPLAKVEIERWFLSDRVKRVPVRTGRIRGTMFIPEGPGPFPAVLDVRGNGGGIQEFRGALLASKGFITYVIAYLGYEDLPKTLDICDIEYFEEGARFLYNHTLVANEWGIGAIGLSYGGLIIQALGIFIPDIITCAVSINGPHIGQIIPITYKGRVWTAMQMNQLGMAVENGAIIVKDSFPWPKKPNDDPDLTLDLTKFKGDLMLISGDADRAFYSSWCSEKARETMEKGGKTNFEIVRYPGAGHFIEPPYNPFFARFVHKVERQPFFVGGTKRGVAFANKDSWERYIAFFKKHLGTSSSKL